MGGRLFPQRARRQLVPVVKGVRSRAAEAGWLGPECSGHAKFGVLQDRKPDPRAEGCTSVSHAIRGFLQSLRISPPLGGNRPVMRNALPPKGGTQAGHVRS